MTWGATMRAVQYLRAGMIALAAAGLGLGAAPARAGVITFDVSGSMTPALNAACSPTCTLGGNIVFDNSAGAPHMGISADITLTGFSPGTGPFTGFAGITAVAGLTHLTIDDASGDFVELVFSTPTAGSLAGYTGGSLDASTLVMTAGLPPSRWTLISGSLASQAAVPEPSSLLLMLSGLTGMGLLLGKRVLPRRLAPGRVLQRTA